MDGDGGGEEGKVREGGREGDAVSRRLMGFCFVGLMAREGVGRLEEATCLFFSGWEIIIEARTEHVSANDGICKPVRKKNKFTKCVPAKPQNKNPTDGKTFPTLNRAFVSQTIQCCTRKHITKMLSVLPSQALSFVSHYFQGLHLKG